VTGPFLARRVSSAADVRGWYVSTVNSFVVVLPSTGRVSVTVILRGLLALFARSSGRVGCRVVTRDIRAWSGWHDLIGGLRILCTRHGMSVFQIVGNSRDVVVGRVVRLAWRARVDRMHENTATDG
jgi:hypothetical protein